MARLNYRRVGDETKNCILPRRNSGSSWTASVVKAVSLGCVAVRGILRHLFQTIKGFMEAGRHRLAGKLARATKTDEVKELRGEFPDLREVVAEQTLKLRGLKKG